MTCMDNQAITRGVIRGSSDNLSEFDQSNTVCHSRDVHFNGPSLDAATYTQNTRWDRQHDDHAV